jgi:hypothetical protein
MGLSHYHSEPKPREIRIQPFYCEECKQCSFVRLEKGADVMSVIHLIANKHKRISPECKNAASHIRVGQPEGLA